MVYAKRDMSAQKEKRGKKMFTRERAYAHGLNGSVKEGERVAYTRGGRASVQGVHALGLVYLCAEDVRIVFVLEKLTEGVLEFRCC